MTVTRDDDGSVKILYFASVRELTRKPSDAIALADLQQSTVAGVVHHLVAKYGEKMR